MGWSSIGALLEARPDVRQGRKVYRIANIGDAPASEIEVTLRRGGEGLSDALLLGRLPAVLLAGASVLIGLAPRFQDAAVLTVRWQGPNGGERRWHGPASALLP
jgi:hypothetical protein